MRKLLHVCGVLIALFACGASLAGVINEVPSCYKANKLDGQMAVPAKEIFVLIDQTTLFDERLQSSVLENTWGYLGLNSAYTIVSFSAFSQGRYTEVISAGAIEPVLAAKERDSISVRLLKTFDACMRGQEAWAKKRAVEAIKKTFASASPALAKSDILAALKDVAARVKASAARDKVLFVVSDMLENSTISSFYASSMKMRAVEKGEVILRQGDVADSLYIIIAGQGDDVHAAPGSQAGTEDLVMIGNAGNG